MKLRKNYEFIWILSFFNVAFLLSGCTNNLSLMYPQGQIGIEQRSLILTSLCLMLVVVIPAIVMALIFSFKYRSSNNKANYNPDWAQSNKIELAIWTIPIIIIIILARITWQSSYRLDPSTPITADMQPINIEVIALNWKWLFIYPEEGIATINEIVFPINTPIRFNITADSLMNSFFIPQLGSQLYAMPGMRSNLYLIANKPGCYKGISSNFSGQGFSGMKFTAIATANINEFHQWLQKVKRSPNTLRDIDSYKHLAFPSEFAPVEYYSTVKPNLFNDIINKFMEQEPHAKNVTIISNNDVTGNR